MWTIKEHGEKIIIVPYSECEIITSEIGTFAKTKINGKNRYSNSHGWRDERRGYFFTFVKGKCIMCHAKKHDFLMSLDRNYSEDECICPECIISVSDDFIIA